MKKKWISIAVLLTALLSVTANVQATVKAPCADETLQPNYLCDGEPTDCWVIVVTD